MGRPVPPSCHEGTNNAIFTCAAPVMPTNSMEKAAKTLLFNADLKTQNTMIKMEHKFASRKLWSGSPTSAHVADLAENLILTEWRKGKDYMSYRSNTRRWFVCHKNEIVDVDVVDEDSDDDWEDPSTCWFCDQGRPHLLPTQWGWFSFTLSLRNVHKKKPCRNSKNSANSIKK